jgi:RNA polymerase-binding transcription factor DksA
MNTVNPSNHLTRLIKRRAEIETTLRHVEHEQLDVEAKAASMDRDARAKRLMLLRDLNDWYSREIGQVDDELRRDGRDSRGVCRACGAPSAVEQLASYTGTELCARCRGYLKWLRAER